MDCWRIKLERTRASGERPARATPRCLSIEMIFFWYEPSSSAFLYIRSKSRSISIAFLPGHIVTCKRRFRVTRLGQKPTFRATRATCVFDLRPTAAEPCLIASRAYSTWNILPCGELYNKQTSYQSAFCGIQPAFEALVDVTGDAYNVTESLS